MIKLRRLFSRLRFPFSQGQLGKRRRLWITLVLLAADLAIVITGVYVAFLLNEQRERRAQVETKQQLYAALQEEVHDVDANIESFTAGYGDQFSSFEQAYNNGEQPALAPIYYSIVFEPHLFRAAIEGTGLELLNVSLMYDLAEFYNSLDWAFLQLRQLEVYTKDRLVPALDQGTEAFYNEAGRLKEGYRWYIDYNERLLALMNRLDQQADSLERRLAQQAKMPTD